ncbi:acyl-CoA dehydrogenase family protein [Nonomuraea thailandensis]
MAPALADELRAAVRDYLAGRPGASWREFARDVGIAGLLVPEKHGGTGCGPVEMAAVAEELGRVLSPHPFLQSAVMAVEAAAACGADELLEALAGGVSATVVLPGDGELRLDGELLTGWRRTRWRGNWCWCTPAGRWWRPCPRGGRRT